MSAFTMPQRPIAGIFLLACYLLIFFSIFRKERHSLKQDRRAWGIVFGLSLFAFLLTQFLVFSTNRTAQLPLLTTTEQPVTATPFGFVPALIAALPPKPHFCPHCWLFCWAK